MRKRQPHLRYATTVFWTQERFLSAVDIVQLMIRRWQAMRIMILLSSHSPYGRITQWGQPGRMRGGKNLWRWFAASRLMISLQNICFAAQGCRGQMWEKRKFGGAVSKWLKQAMRGSAFFRNIFGQAKTECRKNGTQEIIFIRNSKWNEL